MVSKHTSVFYPRIDAFSGMEKIKFHKHSPDIVIVLLGYRLSSIKGHNLLSYFPFSKKYSKCFILLPAFYLIMWLMKLPKKFEKIAILKIGELVSF